MKGFVKDIEKIAGKNNDFRRVLYSPPNHRWHQGGPGDDVIVIVNLTHSAYENYQLGFPSAMKKNRMPQDLNIVQRDGFFAEVVFLLVKPPTQILHAVEMADGPSAVNGRNSWE